MSLDNPVKNLNAQNINHKKLKMENYYQSTLFSSMCKKITQFLIKYLIFLNYLAGFSPYFMQVENNKIIFHNNFHKKQLITH